ncbi:polysaccharide biosynthesis protein CapD [Dethiosulfatarculus sandiegensis]|uniref:Polysaccharide biosynthesis protein CapD n=1 Tax=Dethiosulfatarculus sandiegensis TaxID=1429043 RepID=A0A0D2JPJ1_9BACT|nr:polysaccharide biosynthesis protein CapD [Dethiosulfatarculus sandiegensis]
MQKFFKGAKVGVTGVGGTVGRELLLQLLNLPVDEVRGLEIHESHLFSLDEEYRDEERYHPFLCDISESHNLERMFSDLDYVFHTAAFKHVPLCEKSPFTAVKTNILGVESVIRAALSCKVRKVLFTSSDKAVNPTNVMGTSKLMGERMMTAANSMSHGDGDTAFTSTRFGNVVGSSGSVVPLFCQQIAKGGPVTLTDPMMTRFVMSLSQATELVMQSMTLAKGGEVFVTKMPVVSIKELAEVMIELLAPVYERKPEDVELKIIGPRPGEKMYEELLNEEEVRRTLDAGPFFAILPAFRNIYEKVEYTYEEVDTKPAAGVYNSFKQQPFTINEIRDFLFLPGVLPDEIREKLET